MVDSTSNISKNGVNTQNRVQSNERSEIKTGSASNVAAPQDDSVQLTDAAKNIANAESALSKTPDIDQGKIESIKKALSEGTYPLDAKKTAKNMADLESLVSTIGK